MTDTTQELLNRVDRLPYGAAFRAESEKLVAHAAESEDLDLEFQARMRLTSYAVMSGVSDLALTNFAWCIAKHKENPARFAGDAESPSGTIFWHYKWMPGLLTGSPAFDAAQIDSVLSDFEATYRASSLPLSALVTAKMETAIRMRRAADAERWGAELKALPRDAHSSCDACVPSNYVDLDLLRGDDDAAAKRALKMWKKGVSCADEPETMLASALLAMLRSGRVSKAVKAFEYVYESSRNDRDGLGRIADCVTFAAVTGNEERAFEMIERHLGWLAHDALGESEHRDAAAAFGVALSRLAAAGYGDVIVRGSADPQLAAVLPPSDSPLTVAELAGVMWSLAEHLSAAFDARNGNDGYKVWLDGMRALVNANYPVALPGAEEGSFRPMLVRRAVPATADEWLERALDHRWAGEQVLALAAVAEALPGLEGRQRARAYGLQRTCAEALAEAELQVGATEAWLAAVDAAYGAETAAFALATFDSPSVQDVASAVDSFPGVHLGFVASAHAASAAALLGGDVNEERLAEAAGLLDKARESAELVSDDRGSRRPFVSILLFSAQVAAARGLPADALAAIDTALAMAPSRTVEAVLTGAKAEVFAGAGDMEGAAELHGVAVAVAAAAGHPGLAAEQAINAGNAFAEADEHHEAATRYAYALSLNPPGATSPLGLRWAYALSSLNSGGAEVAIPILEDMRNEEAGDAPAAALAETRYHLARAYDATYDDRAAAEYLAAAHGAMGADSHALAAVAAYAAGRELHYQERVTEAIEAFELARGALAVAPNPGLEVDLLLSYAGSLGAAGNGSWQAAADEAVALAEAQADEGLNAKAHFIRLSLLDDLEVHDRVIELAEGVSARMLGLGESGRAVAAIHWQATALLATDHFEDAIAALTTVARDEAFDVDERVVCAQRLAETFAEAGRKPEAAQWKAYGKKLSKP